MSEDLRRSRPGRDWAERDARSDEEPNADEVDEMVRSARRQVGRPSIGGEGVTPTMNVRVSPALRDELDRIAGEQGRRTSDVAREALAEYAARH